MVALRSFLLATASAFTISNVVAHPHGAHHAHHAYHAKRQEDLQLSYVTLYQTQAAGPNGTAIVYTLTSPVWVPAGAVGTATGTHVPVITSIRSSVAVTTPMATPTPITTTELAVPVSSTVSSSSSSSTTSSTSVVVQATIVPDVLASNPTEGEVAAGVQNPEASSGSGSASGEYTEYSGTPSEYPAKSEWLSFEAIFEASKGDASKGMLSYGMTEDQMSSLASGIKAAAASTGVDARIVLVLTMQETRGVATTGGGGLIQATGADGRLCDGSWVRVLCYTIIPYEVQNSHDTERY
jgi:hypothetical protein